MQPVAHATISRRKEDKPSPPADPPSNPPKSHSGNPTKNHSSNSPSTPKPTRATLKKSPKRRPDRNEHGSFSHRRSEPDDSSDDEYVLRFIPHNRPSDSPVLSGTLVQRRIHIRTRRPGILTTQTMSSWISRTSALHCNHSEHQRRKKPSRQTHMTKIGSSLYLSRSRSFIAAARNTSASHGHYAQVKAKVSRSMFAPRQAGQPVPECEYLA